MSYKTKETWKPINGFEDCYEISSAGRVRSVSRYVNGSYGSKYFVKGKLKTPQKRPNGYLFVSLHRDARHREANIHRLVAENFIPNPNNYPVVNHKDEDKTNNCVENLEWCSHSYNSTYGSARKNVEESHRKPIIKMDLNGNELCVYKSLMDAEASVGGKGRHANISSACRGRNQTAYGYKWKYAKEE